MPHLLVSASFDIDMSAEAGKGIHGRAVVSARGFKEEDSGWQDFKSHC